MNHSSANSEKPAPRVAVTTAEAALASRAEALARELGLPCHPGGGAADEYDFLLEYISLKNEARLRLRPADRVAGGPLALDFTGGALGYRTRRRQHEPIARAVGWTGNAAPSVLDATAGLGRDAFVLATLGCAVTAVERSPVVAALLRAALERAARHPATQAAARRMNLRTGDARALLEQCSEDARPDVVYLDPMYPEREKSALVKKEMRLLRALAGDDEDAPHLLACALTAARKRVVVKRPRLAPPLDGPAPSFALTGSTTRFDIYLCKPLQPSATHNEGINTQ